MVDRVVVFDSHCLLCSRFIRILLGNDEGQLWFTDFDSAYSKTILPDALLVKPETVVFFDEGVVSVKSKAVFNILRYTGARLRWIRVFRIFPGWLSDKIYDWVANNRYDWFGKSDQCYIPESKHSGRFLD